GVRGRHASGLLDNAGESAGIAARLVVVRDLEIWLDVIRSRLEDVLIFGFGRFATVCVDQEDGTREMPGDRIGTGDGLDLLERFALVAANNPRRLYIKFHQIPPCRQIRWVETNGLLEGSAHLPGHRKTPILFGRATIGATQPATVFRVARLRGHCTLAIGDRSSVVPQFQVRPRTPVPQRGVMRTRVDGRRQRCDRRAIVTALELRARGRERIRRALNATGEEEPDQEQRDHGPELLMAMPSRASA